MDTQSQEKLNGILIKDISVLGEEEKAFLRARRSYLSGEDAKKYAEVLGEAKKEVVEKVKVKEEEKPKKKPKK